MLSLELRAVQFFSRPLSRDYYVDPKTILATNEERQLEGYLKIQFGSPMLVGVAEGTRVRPNYAQPWETPDGPSIGAVQWVDPYAEIRWPSYALATFNGAVTSTTLDMAAQRDILQRIRCLISFEICQLPELTVMTDQFLSRDGYRYGYWTPGLDFVRNPVPAPGRYANADRGEPIGPGHASLFATEFTNGAPRLHSCALVWSQAFAFPNRTNVHTDEAAIRKRAQAIKWHYNSKDELTRALDYFRNGDIKGCVRSSAFAVEAALKHYSAEWGVASTAKHLSFDQKIEHVLQQAGRPSYRTADSVGLRELQHLYRARNASHEGDCYYRDDTLGAEVVCDISHADRFFHVAQAFTFWLDSQA